MIGTGRACWSGIPLGEGLGLLQSVGASVLWRASPFWVTGCAEILPNFAVAATEPSAEADSNPITIHLSPSKPLRVPLRATLQSRAELSAADVMSAPPLSAALGDKCELPAILRGAGVSPIPHALVSHQSTSDARAIWASLGGRSVVVQRSGNEGGGTGTTLIETPGELEEQLRAWRDSDLKVSALVDGPNFTASGCVTADVTVVSGVTHQLVGIPELNDRWGGYGGNQLVTVNSLPERVIDQCHDSVVRVGDELRRRGYRGAFGLDLVCSADETVWVIEINPRLHGAMALLNTAEYERQLMPLAGVHLLTFLFDHLPALVAPTGAGGSFSQMVLYSRTDGVVTRSLSSGNYRMFARRLERVNPPSLMHVDRDKEFVLWTFVNRGEQVPAGTMLAVMQLRRPVADVFSRGALNQPAADLAERLGSAIVVDAAADRKTLRQRDGHIRSRI